MLEEASTTRNSVFSDDKHFIAKSHFSRGKYSFVAKVRREKRNLFITFSDDVKSSLYVRYCDQHLFSSPKNFSGKNHVGAHIFSDEILIFGDYIFSSPKEHIQRLMVNI